MKSKYVGMVEIDLCAKYLAGACVETNAETLTYTLTGFSVKGIKHGDFKITCKQIKKPSKDNL